MGWISVKDRLPDKNNMEFIVFARDCIIADAWFNEDGFKWDGFFGSPDYSEVTHWMELPEPPKD